MEPINIPTKSTGDTLTAGEFNLIPSKVNELVNAANTTETALAGKAAKGGNGAQDFNARTLTVSQGVAFSQSGTTVAGHLGGLQISMLNGDNAVTLPVARAASAGATLVDNVALDAAVAAEAAARTAADDAVTASIPHEAMVAFAALGGATYDSATNRWSLNGLTDITEAQMRVIFAASFGFRTGEPLAGRFCQSTGSPTAGLRTNLWFGGGMLAGNSARWGEIYQGQALDASVVAYNSSSLEVLKLAPTASGFGVMLKGTCVYAFASCSNLKKVIGTLDMRWCEPSTTMWRNCTALEEVTIAGLCANISFAWSPSLKPESVAFIINNSYGTANIGITLHADAYAVAILDPGVLGALQEHTNVQLISA